jgi:glutamine amidotransferase|tara:strand:+ start:1587 stop:2243 length:657 start_codon:yes stop_codon:yes gene_type:complete
MSSPESPVKPKLAVIDYGMGNLRSVVKAWEHVGADVQLISQPSEAEGADALVFPGQGAIVDTMELLQRTGFDNLVREWIGADKPFFGICLGLQALFESSEEGGGTPCLGIFPGEVKRFSFPAELGLKVPHMGWNTAEFTEKGGLKTPLGPEGEAPFFYFVHSYHVDTAPDDIVWAKTTYGAKTFVSAIQRGRCFATQFHPEKSQRVGLELYRAFLETL